MRRVHGGCSKLKPSFHAKWLRGECLEPLDGMGNAAVYPMPQCVIPERPLSTVYLPPSPRIEPNDGRGRGRGKRKRRRAREKDCGAAPSTRQQKAKPMSYHCGGARAGGRLRSLHRKAGYYEDETGKWQDREDNMHGCYIRRSGEDHSSTRSSRGGTGKESEWEHVLSCG